MERPVRNIIPLHPADGIEAAELKQLALTLNSIAEMLAERNLRQDDREALTLSLIHI